MSTNEMSIDEMFHSRNVCLLICDISKLLQSCPVKTSCLTKCLSTKCPQTKCCWAWCHGCKLEAEIIFDEPCQRQTKNYFVLALHHLSEDVHFLQYILTFNEWKKVFANLKHVFASSGSKRERGKERERGRKEEKVDGKSPKSFFSLPRSKKHRSMWENEEREREKDDKEERKRKFICV